MACARALAGAVKSVLQALSITTASPSTQRDMAAEASHRWVGISKLEICRAVACKSYVPCRIVVVCVFELSMRFDVGAE